MTERYNESAATSSEAAITTGSGKYWRRFYTLAHEFLDLESQVSPVPDAAYVLLDSLIAEAKNSIHCERSDDREQATKTLKQIEDLLRRRNFVCSLPRRVHSLREALTAKPLDPVVIATPQNERRRCHIDSRANEKFCHIDCDTGSFLYLSIAEELKLPLSMVEVPEHNFVRWHLDESHYINWDTNYGYGKYPTDKDYREQWRIPLPLITNGTYLASLSRSETKGYFYFLRALSWCDEKRKNFLRGIEDYRNAIVLYPKSSTARNNLAWLYVTEPAVQYMNPSKEALRLALEAVAIYRTPNDLGTLACVYAENRDFSMAVKTAEDAFGLSDKKIHSEMIKVFKQGKTYLEHRDDFARILGEEGTSLARRHSGPRQA